MTRKYVSKPVAKPLPSEYHNHWFQAKVLDNIGNRRSLTTTQTAITQRVAYSSSSSKTNAQYAAFKRLYRRQPTDLSVESYGFTRVQVQLWANIAAGIMSYWFCIPKYDMTIHTISVQEDTTDTSVWCSLVEMPQWGRVLVVFEHGGPHSSVLIPHINIQWDAICVLRHNPNDCAYFIPTGNQSLNWLQLPIFDEHDLTVFALANIGKNPRVSINNDILTHFAGDDACILMEKKKRHTFPRVQHN